MRMCAELAELGMDLARAAAAKAHADGTKQEEPPSEEPPSDEPLAEPEVAAPTHLTQAAKSPRAAGTARRAATAKPADPAIMFTRLAATVLASITLESRLAAGLTTASRGTSPTRRADPRRAPLRDILSRITEHHPDRAELVRETTARIDADLAADPHQAIDLPTLFFSICEDFRIEVDLAHLPDQFLGVAPDVSGLGDGAANIPYPRATSPP